MKNTEKNNPRNDKSLHAGSLKVGEISKMIESSYTGEYKNVDEYVFMPNISTIFLQVYKNIMLRQLVVVLRGSVEIKDWLLNKKLWSDNKAEDYRVKVIRNIITLLKKQYPDYKITTLGHSLGGFLASLMPDQVFESIGLNSYIPKSKIFEKISDNEYLVRSDADIPSLLNKVQRRKNVKTIPRESMDPLKEHSWKVINRLGKEEVIGRKMSL